MNIEPRIHIDALGPLLPDKYVRPQAAHRPDRIGQPFVGLSDAAAALSVRMHEAFAEGPDLYWHRWAWTAYLGLYRPPEPGSGGDGYHLVGHNTMVASCRVDLGIDNPAWTTPHRYACAATHWMWTTDCGPGNVPGTLASLQGFKVGNRRLVAEIKAGTLLTWIDLRTGALAQRHVQADTGPPRDC